MNTPQNLWVEYRTTKRNYVDLVSTEGCVVVDEFLDKISERPRLAIPKDIPFALFDQEGNEIDPGVDVNTLIDGKDRKKPLVVKCIIGFVLTRI